MKGANMVCDKCGRKYAIMLGEAETFDDQEEQECSTEGCDGRLVKEDIPKVVKKVCDKCGTPCDFVITDDLPFEYDENAEEPCQLPGCGGMVKPVKREEAE